MPDVGRFFNIDPLSEKYTHNSTYAFSENKVINARELEGLEAIDINDSHGANYEGRSYDGGITGKINDEWQIKEIDNSWMVQNSSFRADMVQENNFDLGNALSDAFFGLGSQESWNNYTDNLSRYESAVANSKAAQPTDGFYYMFGGMLVAPFAMSGIATIGGGTAASYLEGALIRGATDVALQQGIKGSIDWKQTGINAFLGGGQGFGAVQVNWLNFGGNMFNNFGTSYYKGGKSGFKKDFGINSMKALTGGFGMGVSNYNGLAGGFLNGYFGTTLLPGVYFNTTDIVIENKIK